MCRPIPNIETFLREFTSVKIKTNEVQNYINIDVLKIKIRGKKTLKKLSL